MGTLRSVVEEPPHDPFMTSFERGVALIAYGLLFVSPFGLGVPALVGLMLAFVHRDDPHSLTRSHYRFQVRIFWTTLVCLVLGAALAIGAGGFAIGTVYHFLRENLPQLGLPVGGFRGMGDAQQEGGWLLLAGLAFLAGAVVYIMTAALYGFIKLLAGRPIRHRTA